MVDYTEEVCDKKDGCGGVHGLDVDRVGSRLHTHTGAHTHIHKVSASQISGIER